MTSPLLISLATAWFLVGLINLYRTLRFIAPGSAGVIRSGPWSARLTDNGRSMTWFQRAALALVGPWGLVSSEAIYFTAFHDSDGRLLRCGRTYRVEGVDLPARWWSLTAYRNFHFIANAANRYSYSATNVTRGPDGSWLVTLAPAEHSGNWIPTGEKPGLLTLILRLYVPDPRLREEFASLQLPRITRHD